MGKKKKKNRFIGFPKNCKGTNVSNASFEDIKKVCDIYQRSETSHYVERLDEIINQSGYVMSNWEVEQLNNLLDKFSAKYNSPLAKAMK